MTEELKKLDYTFAEEIKESKDKMHTLNIVSNALIRMGLRQTAKQMLKKLQHQI